MKHPDDGIAEFLPLSVKDFHLMFSLSDEPLHGYAIVKSVEDRTDGVVRLEPANLYRRIHGFVQSGLLQEATRPEGDDTDSRRRYYRLTPLGRRVLQAEVARWAELVSEAGRRGLA